MSKLHTRTVLAALGCFLFSVSAAPAGLPPPQFLPGQPMIVGNQVLIIWTPVPDAYAYAVYRNGERLETVTINQYMAPLPQEPGEHRYQVSALNAEGTEGEHSKPGFIHVRQLTSPKNLMARPDAATGTIGLVWDNVGGAVVYNVYRARDGEPQRLVASVREETYKDADVQEGAQYTYAVTAKNLAGVESSPSERARAQWSPAPTREQRTVPFRALPTAPEFIVEEIGGVALAQVSHLTLGPNGLIWIVTPKTRQIHAVDTSGRPVQTFGPFDFDKTGLSLIPHKLAFGPDGNLYVTDAFNSVLACIDPSGAFLWGRGIITPPPQAEEVWKAFPRHLVSLPATPSSVLCLEDEIWVTDQRFQIIYRFDYGGDFLGYVAGYYREGERVRFSSIGELSRIGKNRFLVTFPLSHWAAVLDRDFRLLQEVGTGGRGHVGGFVGIHGACPIPGNRVLLTDPAVASLQVFDCDTGEYLFHISGPKARRDPDNEQRADLPLRKPNLTVWDPHGRIWLYDAATKRIVVLRPSGEVSPPLKKG